MDTDNTEVTNNMEDTNLVANSLIITFSKIYSFEGQDYNDVDLSGLNNLSASDLIATDNIYFQNGNASPTSDMSLAYACILAAKVAKKPIEFFNQLPAKDAIKVKTMVIGFLYN